jgi:hypothetical protein
MTPLISETDGWTAGFEMIERYFDVMRRANQ